MRGIIDILKKPISTKVGTTVILCSALLLTGGVFTAAKSEFDLSGLNQQVQKHEEQLDNHDARIGNLEKDTEKVQQETGVKPAENKIVVPAVITPGPEPTPTAPTTQPAAVAPAFYDVWTISSNCPNPGTYYRYSYNDGSSVGPTMEWKPEFEGKPQTPSVHVCSSKQF
jgi:hypothetical protein